MGITISTITDVNVKNAALRADGQACDVNGNAFDTNAVGKGNKNGQIDSNELYDFFNYIREIEGKDSDYQGKIQDVLEASSTLDGVTDDGKNKTDLGYEILVRYNKMLYDERELEKIQPDINSYNSAGKWAIRSVIFSGVGTGICLSGCLSELLGKGSKKANKVLKIAGLCMAIGGGISSWINANRQEKLDGASRSAQNLWVEKYNYNNEMQALYNQLFPDGV